MIRCLLMMIYRGIHLIKKLVDEMTENSIEVTSETQKVGFIDPKPY